MRVDTNAADYATKSASPPFLFKESTFTNKTQNKTQLRITNITLCMRWY